MARVALDLLGGDSAPDTVIDGALLALDEQPDLRVTLVGPVDVAERLLAHRGAGGRCDVVAASQVVAMTEDPARAVRAKRDATVRVAARLVRDGAADATVSIGSTGAALAAGLFTLGRLPGVTRPALAVVVPALHAPVVLLDVGATTEAGPDLLAQFALAGAAYARVRLDVARPRIGLLNIGEEQGKGDVVRREAPAVLAAALVDLPVEDVGNVQGSDVPLGGVADVVVTDGFTGNVLLKGLEGTLTLVLTALRATVDAAVLDTLATRLGPEGLGGAMLLGVDGISVVGHGASSPRAVASCLAVAADAARDGLVPRLRADLAELVARRREAAGLPARVGP